MVLEEIISGLDENELSEAFAELVAWRKCGVLGDGVVRKYHKRFVVASGMEDFPIHAMENHFLFEMASRRYR
jgi:hypothetical protein